MIAQAEKEVACVVVFAHHDYMDPEYFIARICDEEYFFAMSVCDYCGKVAVHSVDETPYLDTPSW